MNENENESKNISLDIYSDVLIMVFKTNNPSDPIIKHEVTLEEALSYENSPSSILEYMEDEYNCTESTCQVNGYCECGVYEDYYLDTITVK